MRSKLTFLAMLFLFIGQMAISQNNYVKFAEGELKLALSNKKQHNVIDNKRFILKDSLTAIKVVEPVLFSIYGEENITKQRPYKCVLVDNYWVIFGILQEGCCGGVFMIIIDARNCKVIKITHGK